MPESSAKIATAAAVLLVLLLGHAPAHADASRDVYVGVYLHDVTRFQLRDGMVDVDFELWAKWRGDFDPEQLQVANAATLNRTPLGEASDRDWHTARWRMRGTLRGEFPMQRFPYDEQRVAVVLELPEEYGRLVPDAAGSGMAERFSLTDWLYEPEFHPRVTERTVSSDLGLLSREGLPTTVHRVGYEVMLKRPIVTVALKLFLPLAIIALVSLVALFLPGETIAPRSSIGVTALLSCFAFQFTVADSLPSVSYLTLADILFLIAYFLSSIALVVSIVSHSLVRTAKPRASLWLDRTARVVLPVGAFVAVWAAIPGPAVVEVLQPQPLPTDTRAESARPVLRIGANRMTSLLGSPLNAVAYWEPLHEDIDHTHKPWFLEHTPGIDNDFVRFLADGRLEITWKLREGVRWSDGRPVVARDLTLPWDAYEPEHAVRWQAPDDRTLVVTWDGRLAEALETPLVWPSHVLEETFRDGGYDALRDFRRANPHPGLGPYRVVEFEAGTRAVAERNPEFPGSPGNLERIEIQVADSEALIRAFEAGEIDLTIPNAITMDQALELRRTRPDAVHIQASPFFTFLNPDMNHPLLGRLEVRRAMLRGLNRERIAREVYGDAGRVAHAPVSDLPPGATITPYEPAVARAEMERLGLVGSTIDLITAETEMDQRLGEVLVPDLRAMGWVVRVRTIPSTHRAYLDQGHGGLLLHILRGARDALPRRYWSLPLSQGAYATDVRHDAYTDDIHDLVEREKHALYPERRRQLRDALLALTTERLPNLPCVFVAQRILADPALVGWSDVPADMMFGTGMEQWHFRP